ncbi:MAG: DUF268 domain-containing protein [Patescibacteria group bacterium]
MEKQYVYHIAWATRCLKQINPKKHSDFGSLLYFSVVASAFTPVDFYDFRPAELDIPNLNSQFGDLTHLNIADNSLESVSCLHTVEHVGLGRYGEPIEPEGDLTAINELKRVVQKGGSLLLAVPMGKEQMTEFNGHRIYEYNKFISYFTEFELVDFSYIPEREINGDMLWHTTPGVIGNDHLGCGCFWFKKI